MNNERIKQRISLLWIIILIGLMFHIILHIVPVFYGINIVKKEADGITPTLMVFILGLSFCVPALAILNTQYLRGNTGKLLNMLLSFVALIVNTGHLHEIFSTKVKSPIQLFVLIPLFFVSILLVRDSLKWFKTKL